MNFPGRKKNPGAQKPEKRQKTQKNKKNRFPKILLIVVLLGSVLLLGAGRLGILPVSAALPSFPISAPSLSFLEKVPLLSRLAKRGEGEEAPPAEEEIQPVSADPAADDTAPAEAAAPLPDRSDWRLLLVGKDHFVPMDFRLNLSKVQGDFMVDTRIIPDLNRMLSDAAREGVSLKICSAYRNVRKQREIFDNQIQWYASGGYGKEEALRLAMNYVEKPGFSEHHIGLAVDIVTESYQKLDEGFVDTQAYQWLAQNAHRYGFILRYSKEKQDITGIHFEPWHYRYVGTEHAEKIREQGVCLEEYLGVANPQKAPEEPTLQQLDTAGQSPLNGEVGE